MKVPYIESFENVFVFNSKEEIVLNDINVFGIKNGIIEQINFRIEEKNSMMTLYPLCNDFENYFFISNKIAECISIRIDKSKFFQIYENNKDYIIKVEE